MFVCALPCFAFRDDRKPLLGFSASAASFQTQRICADGLERTAAIRSMGDWRSPWRSSLSAAQDLQLAAILAPMATTELRSQVSPMVATLDASRSAGGIVETQVSKDLVSVLWRHSERKETFSRLETQARTTGWPLFAAGATGKNTA